MFLRAWVVVVVFMGGGLIAIAEPSADDPLQRTRKESTLPLPLDRSAAAMTLPEGFSATLFAGEPDVHQPIAFCFDHKGRLWVAENDSFPKWQQDGKDKIVIFEDTDGDGKFDKRTVFAEGFHYLSALQIGQGGLWVIDSPNMLFFPINAGEDKPAGEPEIVLDGWSWKGIHNLPNSMIWGPDGWLYGCNGTIFDIAIGAPGTPDDQRVKINRGVWRYHPTKKVFERFAEGTANPWGLDYDLNGQFFMTNNVVAHLWHVIQGACYPRIWGSDFNKYSYVPIQTIADHLHWGGGDWTTSRGGEGAHSVAGGGHSHAGCTLYYGDSFPPEYRGRVFMCNTHGHRMNEDLIEAKGSGFVAHHGADFMLANDKWFKGVSAQYGPDGSIYVIDWSDAGECHDYDITDREHGRIYRIAYKNTPRFTKDIELISDEELVADQISSNQWLARHARQILRERGLQGKSKAQLVQWLEKSENPQHRLSAMWTLQTCDALEPAKLVHCLDDASPYVRGWAIQLLAEDRKPSAEVLTRFATMAREDASPVVRLYLASACQRISIEQRKPILMNLIAHESDAGDQNLPQMYWYALEPVIAAEPKLAAGMIGTTKIPQLRQLIARRLAGK